MLLVAASLRRPRTASVSMLSGCKYGSKAYWDGMYSGTGTAAADGLPSDSYSWYCGWREVEPFFRELVPDESVRLLVPGVGNDAAIVDMYDAGYATMTAFDYSAAAVERAVELFGPDRAGATLLCADATDLPFGAASFDACFDKGTLDAIGIAGSEALAAAAGQLWRALVPGGVVVSVSRALEPEAIRAAFDGSDGRRWEELRDGGLHIAEGGEVSTDLAAGLYAWRRPVES